MSLGTALDAVDPHTDVLADAHLSAILYSCTTSDHSRVAETEQLQELCDEAEKNFKKSKKGRSRAAPAEAAVVVEEVDEASVVKKCAKKLVM